MTVSQINTKSKTTVRTHEGAPAIPNKTPLAELRRAVGSCLLFENQFYEDGVAIADRINDLVDKCSRNDVADLAIEARTKLKLRHAPLWLVAGLIKAGKGPRAEVYTQVIQRADEMGELLAMVWKDGRKPLPAAMKRGLAATFGKFDAYQLAKYNRDVAVKLKDVLRIVHPKPVDDERAALYRSIIDGTMASPDTWEVALSSGADKRETFERLIKEGKLGYLALLRNLRNMENANVDRKLVREAIIARRGAHNVLPFRFIAAARAAPSFEPALDEALCDQISDFPILPGRTVILVDVSGSMDTKLSGRSDLTRIDAACGLASIIPGDVRVFSFSNETVEVPPRRGMAGVDAVKYSQPHYGTHLGAAVRHANSIGYDRLIVVTDEQSHDPVGSPLPGKPAYMINVASYKNGVGYGEWTRIDGFSENVLKFIADHEAR